MTIFTYSADEDVADTDGLIGDPDFESGNIVCFRNLKNNTDQAIALFSNPGAQEIILLEPYERHVNLFNDGVIA